MDKSAVKMRSSIACTRCRKSKVKCLNNGVNTPCRACESARRECTYPPPSTPGSRNAGIGNNTTPVRDNVHAGVGLAATGPDLRNEKPTMQRLNVQTGLGGSVGLQSTANMNNASPSNITEVSYFINKIYASVLENVFAKMIIVESKTKNKKTIRVSISGHRVGVPSQCSNRII